MSSSPKMTKRRVVVASAAAWRELVVAIMMTMMMMTILAPFPLFSDAWMAPVPSLRPTNQPPRQQRLSDVQVRPSAVIPMIGGTTRLDAAKKGKKPSSSSGGGGSSSSNNAATGGSGTTATKNGGSNNNNKSNVDSGNSGSGGNNTHKIQVKLLQHVAGTGQAGDVVLVNPAFYNNKLRAQRLARRVTEEEVQAERAQAAAIATSEKQMALRLLSIWGGSNGKSETGDGDTVSTSKPFVLTLSGNKTGPDGHKLFGGIGPKRLLQELKATLLVDDAHKDLADYVERSKHVKIIELKDESSSDGVPLKGDIKQTGNYTMIVSLLRTNEEHVVVKIPLVVEG